jgi:rhamnose transport system ATP-binding protein
VAAGAPLIRLERLEKSYGGVRALRGVTLELASGEVHAVVGENGAGKSTLNKLLAGVVRPDAGRILFEGWPVVFSSVVEAERRGIVLVHQESTAFPHLDAADNAHLMREESRRGGLWLDVPGMRRRTREVLAGLGESFPAELPLERLSLAQRQMVGIARALLRECRLLILDEPTASLSARETEALFGVVRGLCDRGVAVLYVSHRLEEIFALAERVSVLRDGQLVATQPVSETNREELVRLMVGRDVATVPEATSEPRAAPDAPVLTLRGLSRAGAFRDASLEVRAGEIVALAGLVGAGRSEILRAAFGVDAYHSGEVLVSDTPLPPRDSAAAIRAGVALVPEDRQDEGLHLPMSVRENLSMASLPRQSRLGFVSRGAERRRAQEQVGRLAIRTSHLEAPAASLSGGNQQKTLLGKWLATGPRVLLLDEPTRGVDVGSKAEIHAQIRRLADEGAAILLVSSDLPETLSLADRMLVLREGRIAGELSRAEATQERVLELALPSDGPATSENEGSLPQRTAPLGRFRRETGIGIILAALIFGVGLCNPAFLGLENLRDLLVKIAPAVIVGSGLTLVILAREIDISVGSLLGLCSAALGIAVSADRFGLPAWIGVAACLGVGLAGGLLNGFLVAYGRVPSIIATLGTLTVFAGITELLLGGKWITQVPLGLRELGTGAWAGLPYSVWTGLAIALLATWLAARTAFGRRVYALGSHPRAAEDVGVPTRKVRLGVFALTGLLTGVAALFAATQLQVIESGFGKGFELAAVAAVVVGGTSIRGGRGTVLGTVLGASLLGILGTTLIFLKLGESSTYWERAIQGAVILAAVLSESLGRKRRAAE